MDEGLKDGDMELTGKGWHIVKKDVSEISRVTQNLLYSAKKRKPELQQTFINYINMLQLVMKVKVNLTE